MSLQTCLGAKMKCSFGLVPNSLMPTPKTVMTSNMMAANIMDHVPITNIPSFGMCLSIANPAVAGATAAALGVFSPMPCVPVTPAPWVTGSLTTQICNSAALNNTSTLNCVWGGVIMFVNPGQTTHLIP